MNSSIWSKTSYRAALFQPLLWRRGKDNERKSEIEQKHCRRQKEDLKHVIHKGARRQHLRRLSWSNSLSLSLSLPSFFHGAMHCSSCYGNPALSFDPMCSQLRSQCWEIIHFSCKMFNNYSPFRVWLISQKDWRWCGDAFVVKPPQPPYTIKKAHYFLHSSTHKCSQEVI